MSELLELANQQNVEMPQHVGIGYNDHEYDKAIHVVVENISENVDPTVAGVVKSAKGGRILHTPEVQDMFSCGLCGRLSTRLLSILCHRLTHVSEDNPMHCELCDSPVSYSQPSAYSEHYRKVHKVVLNSTTQQRPYRASSRRKPSGGNKSPVKSPAKKELPKRRSQRVSKTDINSQDIDQLSSCIAETPGTIVAANPDPKAQKLGEVIFNVEEACVPEFSVAESEDISDLIHENSEANTNTQVAEHVGLAELSLESAAVNLNIQNVIPDSNDFAASDVVDKVQILNEEIISNVNMPSGQLDTSTQNILVTVLDMQNPSNHSAGVINQVENVTATSSPLPPITPSVTKTLVPIRQKSDDAQTDKDVDFYFLLATNMVRGSSFIYGKQSFKCLHCDYKSFWRSAFIKHMTDKHVEVLSQNEFIEMRSTENNSNHKLMKMSEFISQYHSPTKSNEKRIIPKRQADKHGNFPCSSCNKVFPRWSNLRKHMRIHVPTKNFLCVECGKAFKTKSSLRQHHKTHKREDFTCSACGFQSQISAAIQAHRQFHKQGSYLCDICGNAYMDKSTLNKHKRVHDPNRPYGCPWPQCTWRFKSEMMCNGHYRTHTTDAQFRCAHCGYAFRHKHHLRRHERQTHGIHQEKTRGTRTKVKQDEEAQAVTNITVLRPTLDENNLAQITDGQLLIPITADSDGNPVPLQFEVSNLGAVNVSYQGFLQTNLGKVETSTLYL